MKRLIGLGAALLLLCACVQQAPGPSMMQVGQASFRAVAPAGYCQSDESDLIGLAYRQMIAANTRPGRTVLAVFRPCDEPKFKPAATSWSNRRIIFQAEPAPSTIPGQPVVNRQTYVASLANPTVTALTNQQILAGLRARQPHRVTTGDAQYIGSDLDAVYNGMAVDHGNVTPGVKAETRIVFAQTLIGNVALTVDVVNSVSDRPIADWEVLKKIAAEAVHETIAETDRPVATTLPPAQ